MNNQMRSNVADDRRRERSRRRTLAGSTALLAGLLMSSSTGGVGATPQFVLSQVELAPVDVDTAAVGSAVGAHPSVSGDGRYVVFQGASLSPDDGRTSTIFFTDRESGATTELSPVPDGLRAGDSVHPVISGNGCTVVAVTQMALDVFRDDDTGDRWDVYRSTLPHCDGTLGDWELVSSRTGTGGIARDDVIVARPTTSRSGTLVAYTHPADQLFDAEGISTISLVDATVPIDDATRSRFVAGSPADSPTDTFIHAGLDQPVLSGNGQHLAYRSDATSSDAVPGWLPGLVDGGPATAQVYSWTIAEPDPFLAVMLISALPDGLPSTVGAAEPDISGSGTEITFTSSDTALAAAEYPECAADCPSQVFIAERDSDDDGEIGSDEIATVDIVSVHNDATGVSGVPVAGTSPSTQPSISGDGQLVAFVTRAPNLQLIEVPGVGSGDDGDLLLAEIRNGRLTRLTETVGGILPTPGVHAHPDLSDAGRTAVFDTAAAADLLVDGALAGRQVVARSSDPLLSLPDADMGTTLVGLASDEWYVAVINDGPSSFRPTSVNVSNPRFEINPEKSTCLLDISVPAGGDCTVALTFTPSAPGASNAILTVAEEGFGAVSVSATLEGAGGNPALRIEPASIDIGTVVVGEPSVEVQFDLSNIGFSPTEITSFEISGAHAGDFEFASNNCVFRPLNPRAACSVGVIFTPSDAGRRTALVELATRDDQYTTMVLAGDGEYEPVIQIDSESVEAGQDFLAAGSQYPPNTEVTIVFGDGPNSSVTAVTDADGGFLVKVPVDPNERGGDRTIVVQSDSGAAASVPVEVVEENQTYIGLPGFGLG
jgi:hypothetical protein